MAMLEGWIWEENLQPYLTAIAWAFDLEFSADDWLAISHGVKTTDASGDKWFEYEFFGNGCNLQFALARETGGNEIAIRLNTRNKAEVVRAVGMICQGFSMTARHSK